MHWLNNKGMAEDLKMDRISQKEQIVYFFLGACLRFLFLFWVLWFSLEIDLIQIFDWNKVLSQSGDLARSLFSTSFSTETSGSSTSSASSIFPSISSESFQDYHGIRIRSVLPIGIVALGLWILLIFLGRGFCYWLNRVGDNENFIERVSLMSFPILLRLFIVSLALGGLTWIVSRVLQLFSLEYSIDFGFSYVVFLVFVLFYYLWLGICISRISAVRWQELFRKNFKRR